MTTPAKTVSDGDSKTSGPSDDKTPPEPKNDIDAILAKNQELLDEIKKVKRRADTLENEKRAAETQALKDKEDWKTLAEQRAAELEAANAKLSEKDAADRDRLKLAAVLAAVGGRVDQKYWGLIDLEKVGYNPDTGEVDKTSAAKYADTFKKEHPILVQTKKSDGIVKDAPGTPGDDITYEEWLKLPAKEMAKRLPHVMGQGK